MLVFALALGGVGFVSMLLALRGRAILESPEGCNTPGNEAISSAVVGDEVCPP